MIQQPPPARKGNGSWKTVLAGCLLFIVLGLGGCAGTSQPPQEGPLPPSDHATSQAAQLLREGNQRFVEHRWTAAIGKYEEAVAAQPKLAEAHYNLGLALYKKGPVSASRPHFIEAANLAPGHPVIWNAPPFRKYGTVEPPPEEPASDGHFGHHH